MAPHSSTLAWKIPWMEEPGGLQSMGSLGVRHDWATELNWTECHSLEWVNLTQMTIISTSVEKSPLEKWSSHHSQQKSLTCSTWMQSQKWQNDLCFQGKQFNTKIIQVYALTSNAEVEWLYEDLQDLLELTPQNDVLFIIGDWNAKVGSLDTWSNRQIWPWSTEWSRAKANGVLPREHTGHTKHPLPTTQEKTLHMDITRWSTLKSDWLLYSLQQKMEKLYTVSKNKTRSWLWLRSWTPNCQIQT